MVCLAVGCVRCSDNQMEYLVGEKIGPSCGHLRQLLECCVATKSYHQALGSTCKVMRMSRLPPRTTYSGRGNSTHYIIVPMLTSSQGHSYSNDNI